MILFDSVVLRGGERNENYASFLHDETLFDIPKYIYSMKESVSINVAIFFAFFFSSIKIRKEKKE